MVEMIPNHLGYWLDTYIEIQLACEFLFNAYAQMLNVYFNFGDAWNYCWSVVSTTSSMQNEALNGGGLLFVKKHPNLRVRVVHGNTLTAAVIIKTLPADVKEVFMNGATSKLGRAIALYLCSRGIRVLVSSLLLHILLLRLFTNNYF
jgi:hypothetical protein